MVTSLDSLKLLMSGYTILPKRNCQDYSNDKSNTSLERGVRTGDPARMLPEILLSGQTIFLRVEVTIPLNNAVLTLLSASLGFTDELRLPL